MTLPVFIVIDSKTNEPEIFTEDIEAYNYMKEELEYTHDLFEYDDDDYARAIKELTDTYNQGDFDYFGSYLGERDLYCYRKEIRL